MKVNGLIKDNQQNVRSVVDADGKFVQQTDYYPYGMPKANSNGQGVNRYKYSSKEYETESGLNLYDFEARMHDPATCLFRTIDPKAGDYPWLNPYLYCAANPIAYIDPTGEDFIYVEDGKEYQVRIEDGKISVYNVDNYKVDSSSFSETSQFMFELLEDLMQSYTGSSVITEIVDSEKNVYLTPTDEKKRMALIVIIAQ